MPVAAPETEHVVGAASRDGDAGPREEVPALLVRQGQVHRESHLRRPTFDGPGRGCVALHCKQLHAVQHVAELDARHNVHVQPRGRPAVAREDRGAAPQLGQADLGVGSAGEAAPLIEQVAEPRDDAQRGHLSVPASKLPDHSRGGLVKVQRSLQDRLYDLQEELRGGLQRRRSFRQRRVQRRHAVRGQHHVPRAATREFSLACGLEILQNSSMRPGPRRVHEAERPCLDLATPSRPAQRCSGQVDESAGNAVRHLEQHLVSEGSVGDGASVELV
mmetsp:Transcript_110046/g.350517  ORF Transcript_110046/g.350517 Transcript_110046/m.350517 type:complete len:275 (-) Transcript_110046:972-1796(-)